MRQTLWRCLFAAVLVLLAIPSVAQTTTPHNPYTIPGIQVRTALQVPVPGTIGVAAPMRAAVFQEIPPCRLMTTLAADQFPAPWGGPKLAQNESRAIPVAGSLVDGVWVDPCSGLVPLSAAAVAARVTVTNAEADGTIYMAPSNWSPMAGLPIVNYELGVPIVEEGGVMLANGSFTVLAWNGAADVQIDVLGYFLEDTLQKEASQPGPQGAKGEPGPAGPAGAQGEPGLTGAQGPQGPIGPTGAQGEQGLTGAQGPQGLQGPAGPQGEAGAVGAEGPMGPAGAMGATGPAGPTGPQGVAGETGAQGPAGVPGATGAQGPAGPTGPTGPTGPAGAAGADGKSYLIAMGTGTFTPGTLRVYDSAITSSSYVFLQYNHPGSPGNACSVEAIGAGWVDVSGSTGKKFMYLVLTPYTP